MGLLLLFGLAASAFEPVEITTREKIDAFDPKSPTQMLGSFEPGTKLTVIELASDTGMYRVKYTDAKEGVIEALCRAAAIDPLLKAQAPKETKNETKTDAKAETKAETPPVANPNKDAPQLTADNHQQVYDYWKGVLDKAGILKELEKKGRKLEQGADGLFALDLSGCAVKDLGPLQGMPLVNLDIGNTGVKDLGPLQGMPLNRLAMGFTRVKDLSPLKGMSLTALNLRGATAPSLSPLTEVKIGSLDLSEVNVVGDKEFKTLEGVEAEELYLQHSPITKLGPLGGMPLKRLYADASAVKDLSGLAGLKLEILGLSGCAGVADISPLKGMPLKQLRLDGCEKVKDLSVVADMADLEMLSIPSQLKGAKIECLRKLTNLRQIGYDLSKLMAPEDFWKKPAAGEKKK
jgi:hypothetical protein